MSMETIRELYEAGVKAGIDFGEKFTWSDYFCQFASMHPDTDIGVTIPDNHAACIVRDKVREWLIEKENILIDHDRDGYWVWSHSGWQHNDDSYHAYESALLAALKHVEER